MENRPKFNEEETTIERVGIWKKWIEQARFGTRKISFEGDPREYSLVDNPTAAPPQRPERRPDLTAKGSAAGQAGQPSAGGGSVPWLIAATAALLIGGLIAWFRLRPRA